MEGPALTYFYMIHRGGRQSARERVDRVRERESIECERERVDRVRERESIVCEGESR